MNKKLWAAFESAEVYAMAAESLTESQWRHLAGLGYQVLDEGGLTYKQKREVEVIIGWAESNVMIPTRQMLDAYMNAWKLPDTKEGYQAASYRLLDLFRDSTVRDDDTTQGQVVDLLTRAMETSKSKNQAQQKVDAALGKRKGWTKDQFRTIDKKSDLPKKAPRE